MYYAVILILFLNSNPVPAICFHLHCRIYFNYEPQFLKPGNLEESWREKQGSLSYLFMLMLINQESHVLVSS